MVKLVKEVIQNNQVIIDVGGGRGDLGLALAKTFPDHQVLVYEPNRQALIKEKSSYRIRVLKYIFQVRYFRIIGV